MKDPATKAPAGGAFGVNDVLVDQTLLCEASRLFERRGGPGRPSGMRHHVLELADSPASNTERLLHLSMLLDALALHDRLFVLKAELPADAPRLYLRNLLVEQGVVRELPTAPYAAAVCDDFRSYFATLESFDGVASLEDLLKFNRGATGPAGPRHHNARLILEAVEGFLDGPAGGLRGAPERFRDYLARRHGGRKQIYQLSEASEPDLRALPFFFLGEEMLRNIDDLGSGYAHRSVSFLRTFVYWRISEHARVALYPSCRRAPQIDLLTDHLRASTAQKVYRVVAEAFESSLKEVFEDDEPLPLYLPPTLAIFLDLYREAGDLPGALAAFRAEFAPARAAFKSLEEEFAAAATLGERRRVKRDLARVLGSLKSHFAPGDDAALETVMGFAPAVLNPLLTPLDPSKYSKELLTKPVGWIRDWWRRRPLRHVFKLKKRLDAVVGYEELAAQTLGLALETEARDYFLRDYRRYVSLYVKDDAPG